MEEIKIPVKLGNIVFKNPFYVASGPTTKTVKQLMRIEETGWAAASIKLTIDPYPYINHKPRYAFFENYNALGFTADKRLSLDEGLTLVRDAKKVLNDLLLFANISYAGENINDTAGWVNMARQFEDAGIDVIELNMCCPNMSFNVELSSGKKESLKVKSGASLSGDPELIAKIVGEIKKTVSIPVFVKLSPEGGQIAESAKIIYAAGADAVGGTGNRMGIPPINLEDPSKSLLELQEEISVNCYSGPWLKPLALRDTYEIRRNSSPENFIMATGGITSWQDAVEMILCGANLTGICTATLLNGYDIVRPMIKEIKSYMERKGFRDLGDFRGFLAKEIKTAREITIHDGYAELIKQGCADKCGLCKKICSSFAPEHTDPNNIVINRELCTGCGVCSYRCPGKNIRMIRK